MQVCGANLIDSTEIHVNLFIWPVDHPLQSSSVVLSEHVYLFIWPMDHPLQSSSDVLSEDIRYGEGGQFLCQN